MVRLPEFDTVATPALAVDCAVLAQNVAEMAGRARTHGVELWPHTQSHKSRSIAALQRNYGIGGLTVATVREAESLADAGFDAGSKALAAERLWAIEARG